MPEGELLVEPVEDPPGHVLQPARHFVGRAHELARLRALVADEGARIIALVAPGGAGKTALARELARTLPAARVWSFYESPDADAFLRGATAHSGFVVLDGLEVLQSNGSPARARGELEAPALRAWLRRVADGKAQQRALVTSRLPLVDVSAWEGGAVTTVALGPLDDASAGALLRRHGLRGDSAAFAEALARFGGHALSLDVLGSLAGRWLDGDAARLPPLDLDAAAEDDPRARRLARLLRHYADRLTPFERDLLARLSAFARGAPVDALAGLAAAPPSLAGALAGATRADIARRLARLADAGLVFAQREGDRYSAHPFVRDVFRALGPERELHDRARVELLATLDLRPGAVALDPASHARFGELLEHTLGAGRVDDAAGLYLGAMGGFAHLGMVRGAFAEGLSAVSAFSPERHPASLVEGLSSSHRLALTYDWSLYAVALGELRVAEAALRAHEAAARAANAQGRLLVAHRASAYALRLAGRFDEALAHALASVTWARALDSRHDEAVGHALEGMILHARGDLDEALAAFLRAGALGDRPSARRALWEASLRLELGDTDAAHALARAVRDEVALLRWRVHAAEADALLGAVALARGETAACERHLAAARAVADATGDAELTVRAHALEHRLAAAAGDTMRAARALAEGRACITAHGLAGLAPRRSG